MRDRANRSHGERSEPRRRACPRESGGRQGEYVGAQRVVQAGSPAPETLRGTNPKSSAPHRGRSACHRGNRPARGIRAPPGSRRTRTRRACAARGTQPCTRRGKTVYPHPRLDEVAAVGLGGDLQPLAFEAHTVVPTDRVLMVLAQDVGQPRTDEGSPTTANHVLPDAPTSGALPDPALPGSILPVNSSALSSRRLNEWSLRDSQSGSAGSGPAVLLLGPRGPR